MGLSQHALKLLAIFSLTCHYTLAFPSGLYDMSLKCEGIEYSLGYKNGKLVKKENFYHSSRTLHIRNKKISEADCKTWTEDKIICSRGCMQLDEYCRPHANTGYFLKIDRVTGQAHEQTWWTSQSAFKTSTYFSGECHKIEGRKF